MTAGAPNPPADFDAARLREHFLRDRYAACSGISLTDVGPGRATATLTVGDHHLNAADIAHGGAIFTLADFAAAVASNTRGRQALAVQVDMHFLKPVHGGVLVAEAHEVSCGPRLASYDVEVRCAGELVATLRAMAYRRQQPALTPPAS